MLEEGEHHRGRGTPASQVKHDYLAEAAGTPDSLGELNLLDSLDEYNEDSSTVDASAADVDAIARSVSATPPLVTTIYPPPPRRRVWEPSLSPGLGRWRERRLGPPH